MPAQAGIHVFLAGLAKRSRSDTTHRKKTWMPAFAGMTHLEWTGLKVAVLAVGLLRLA